VLWMRKLGWDAYGIDVAESYLRRGRAALAAEGYDEGCLRSITNGHYPFDSSYFDVVLSDQVIEHVFDVRSMVMETRRVSQTGCVGLHIFPPRLRVVEPHMGTPFVHWIPPGAQRDRALRLCLRLGLAQRYFTDYSLDERVRIFAEFSESDVCYHRLSDIRYEFTSHDHSVHTVEPTAQNLANRFPKLPRHLRAPLAHITQHFSCVYMLTEALEHGSARP